MLDPQTRALQSRAMRGSSRSKLLPWVRGGALIALLASTACSHDDGGDLDVPAQADLPGNESSDFPNSDTIPPPSIAADVLSVSASGSSGAYTFAVTLRSPDTGCEQYADWWEVLTPQGSLIYRRILVHSHVDEQPFTRSGGPVEVDDTTEVVVRAHMNEAGYGGVALRGSIGAELSPDPSLTELAPELAGAAPLPTGCAF